MHRYRLATLAVFLVGGVATGCSSDGDSVPPAATAITPPALTTPGPATTESTTTAEIASTESAAATEPPTTTQAPTTTTFDPASLAGAYEQPGPYPVGVMTAEIDNGIMVEIWYPAVEGSSGTETYDVRDFTAPQIKALLTADVPASFSYAALRNAEVADGTFPVVLNSHGFAGIRVGSSFLTSHLASWGMIVVSPDHPTRDLYHAVAGLQPDVPTESADDLLHSLDLISIRGVAAGDAFEGHVDVERVAALGHSAGGGTVLTAALDPRVDGYVSMASGLFGDTAASDMIPDKPSFFLAGSVDGVADPARTLAAFESAPAPSTFWEIANVGHNGFDDFCTFGNGKGIIGVAEAAGLGAFLDAQPQFRALGEDGCIPPAAPVGTTFPMIQHAVTAWLLWLFGVDSQPKGLGAESADSYAEQVRIDTK